MPALLLKNGMLERDSWPLRCQHSCVKFPFTVRRLSNVTIHCRTGQSTGQNCYCIFHTRALKQINFFLSLIQANSSSMKLFSAKQIEMQRLFYIFPDFTCFKISINQRTSVSLSLMEITVNTKSHGFSPEDRHSHLNPVSYTTNWFLYRRGRAVKCYALFHVRPTPFTFPLKSILS